MGAGWRAGVALAAAAAVVAGLSGRAAWVAAKQGGIGARTAGCTCHSASASPDVSVSVTGPSVLEVGAQGTYTLSIAGGPGIVGGFDGGFFDAQGEAAGSIVVTDTSSSQLVPGLPGEITHTHPTSPPLWSFGWVAPTEPGSYTLQAAGLSANDDGATNGDEWALGTLAVSVTCNPGTQRSCGTDVGACQAGTQTCLPDGSAFGPCEGEVGPADEVCDGLDNDCDGEVDNGCPGLACSGEPRKLGAGPMRVIARKPGRGRIRSRRTRLAVPVGLDPTSGQLTLKLESDGGALLEVSVPLERKRKRFLFKKRAAAGAPQALGKGSRIVLSRSRAGTTLRLDVILRGLTLGLDPASPPPTITEWVRLGTTCFRGKLGCRILKHGKLLRCRR